MDREQLKEKAHPSFVQISTPDPGKFIESIFNYLLMDYVRISLTYIICMEVFYILIKLIHMYQECHLK